MRFPRHTLGSKSGRQAWCSVVPPSAGRPWRGAFTSYRRMRSVPTSSLHVALCGRLRGRPHHTVALARPLRRFVTSDASDASTESRVACSAAQLLRRVERLLCERDCKMRSLSKPIRTEISYARSLSRTLPCGSEIEIRTASTVSAVMD